MAFAVLAQERAAALCIATDTLFVSRRKHVVELAARHRIPTIYPLREFVVAGGLASYGANLADLMRQAGVYVGRILHGAKPADLPVVQSATFELVINLKTAKALDLAVPPSLPTRVDEVIE